MSFKIVIEGKKEGLSEEDAAIFEEQVSAKAHDFARMLEGVEKAEGKFGSLGTRDLLVHG